MSNSDQTVPQNGSGQVTGAQNQLVTGGGAGNPAGGNIQVLLGFDRTRDSEALPAGAYFRWAAAKRRRLDGEDVER